MLQPTDLFRIGLKHKWTLLLVLLLACGVAAVRAVLSTPVYRSTVVLELHPPKPRVVAFPGDPDKERLGNDLIAMRTQQELLKSRSLAERVIDDLRLDRAPSAAGVGAARQPAQRAAPEPQEVAAGDVLARLRAGYRRLAQPSVSNREVLGREAAIGSFLASLTVEAVRGSRLVKLHVDNTDATLAARIANSTVQAFIAMGMERRLESSSYAKSFLEDQIRQIKARLEESERRLNNYAQANQILTLDEKTSAINQTYSDFASALAKAEQERIKADAILAEVKRNPEASIAIVENKTVQAYKERRARLQIEYQENLRIYKPDFPKMQQIQAQIAEIDKQIRSEIDNVAGSLQAARDAAVRGEELLRGRVHQTRKQVLTTQDHSIDMNLLKREIDSNRQLYDHLLQRFNQLAVSSDLDANGVTVVDAARPALFPHTPNLPRNLLAALAAGLVLGIGIVLVVELLDDSVVFPAQVEPMFGLPVLGIIPKLARPGPGGTPVAMQVHEDPGSTIAEAYRSVRTALQFSADGNAPRHLVVTSAARSEGKSTTALALAINFAQMGRRVLLIDADLRDPSIHTLLGIPNRFGLSNLLAGDSRGTRMILSTGIPNLSVLTAGPAVPNAVELLTGPRLQVLLHVTAALGVDHVIADAPPMLGLADAVVLGKQLRNSLFVVQAGRTRKAVVRNALRRLRQGGLVPRGIVLTQAPEHTMPEGYDAYYGNAASGARLALGTR